MRRSRGAAAFALNGARAVAQCADFVRWLRSALVLLCAVIGAHGQASLGKLPRTELYGHSYVRLEDWARACNFSVRYTTGSPVVMVTNRWARLRFETDSRKAEL